MFSLRPLLTNAAAGVAIAFPRANFNGRPETFGHGSRASQPQQWVGNGAGRHFIYGESTCQ